MEKVWYTKSFRRHLLDMHIDDWNDNRFLSKFSPREYYENLKRANVKSAMIYLQSHIGYCYYPTKIGHIHSAFKNRPGAMKELVDLCHQGGIDVIAYYSINYNNIENETHPDWATIYRKMDGVKDFSGSRYKLCCPNNPDYIEFVHMQIREILDYANFDGIFFDMPFWQQICNCECCRAKWNTHFKGDIPMVNTDPHFDEFMRIREEWTDEYISEITALCKRIQPEISVEYNYACAAQDLVARVGSEVINKYNDYASGDLYRGFLVQSFACKFYHTVTRNSPFEYMTCRCEPDLSCHTVTKSYDKMRLALLMVLAHHGANFVIDAINPEGTMDKRFYDFLRKLYDEVELYEPYLTTGGLIADVAILYVLEARGMRTIQEHSHYNSTVGMAKALMQNHIPFDVLTQATIDRVYEHKAVMLSNPKNLSAETVDVLHDYVKKGGVLYFSGADDERLLQKMLSSVCIGKVGTDCVYVAPCKKYGHIFEGFNQEYPLPFLYELPILGGVKGADVIAKITLPYHSEAYAFSSIHSNPPGVPTEYPAVVKKHLGDGMVIWSSASIEGRSSLCYQKILLNLLKEVGVGKFTVDTNASQNTEIVTFMNEKEALVSAFYVTDDDKTEIQRPFHISLRCKRPKEILLLRNKQQIDFLHEEGVTTFKTQELNVFDMYRIVFEEE